MEDCEYIHECLNADKCYRCFNSSLLKTKQKKQRAFKPASSYKELNKKDSWKKLEQDVADKINNIPHIKEARRSRASGALWFEKGDVVDEILHPECKERSGKFLKTGEQSISLKKEWLVKAKEECVSTSKTMCLPFRFKGDEDIYCIFDFEDIAELVTTMKTYMNDNERLRMELESLKKGNK